MKLPAALRSFTPCSLAASTRFCTGLYPDPALPVRLETPLGTMRTTGVAGEVARAERRREGSDRLERGEREGEGEGDGRGDKGKGKGKGKGKEGDWM